jgi:hypothetical protein
LEDHNFMSLGIFDVSIDGLEAVDIHAQSPCDGGPIEFFVELFVLDFAALENVFSEGHEEGFVLKPKAKIFPSGPAIDPVHGALRLARRFDTILRRVSS